ncbi:MAG: DUF6463 family protein [Actinomycetota bacterium]|nr:DUF6463 family protein [Actinomycetota bacterium]
MIGGAHAVGFTIQALVYGHVRNWLSGDLWGTQVWEAEQSQSQAAFWLSLGSLAVPLVLLAAALLALIRADVPIPGSIGYGLTAWVLACSLIMEPSGFPLGVIPAVMLILAHRRRVAGS